RIKLSVKKFDLLIAQPKLWLTMIDEIPCISFTLGFCSVFKGLGCRFRGNLINITLLSVNVNTFFGGA
ncbi:hypothetical protein Q5W88_21725, partial [Shouchella clausii]|uniref:hypothetical protein n=1 Tax=Shouchella clausii TaxID=79880 RepID=UPI0026F47AF2